MPQGDSCRHRLRLRDPRPDRGQARARDGDVGGAMPCGPFRPGGWVGHPPLYVDPYEVPLCSPSSSGLWEMWETRSVFQAPVGIATAGSDFQGPGGDLWEGGRVFEASFPSAAAGLPQDRQVRHFPQAGRRSGRGGEPIEIRRKPANKENSLYVEVSNSSGEAVPP